MNRRIRFRLLLASATAAGMAAPPAFADRVMRCESEGAAYAYCLVSTAGQARLERDLSGGLCAEGRSWGYDHRGVWVDRGCRGEFSVGPPSPGDESAVTVTGGLALLASVLMSDEPLVEMTSPDDQADGIPNWSIGTFRGYDTDRRLEIELTLFPEGAIGGTVGARKIEGAHLGKRVEIDGAQFDIVKERRGFRLSRVGVASESIYFRRVS